MKILSPSSDYLFSWSCTLINVYSSLKRGVIVFFDRISSAVSPRSPYFMKIFPNVLRLYHLVPLLSQQEWSILFGVRYFAKVEKFLLKETTCYHREYFIRVPQIFRQNFNLHIFTRSSLNSFDIGQRIFSCL